MHRRGSAKSGALFGIVLVVVGSILLLERLDVLPTNLLRHFWPLMITLIGIAMITGNRGPSGRAFGVVMIVMGVGLDLQRHHLIRFNIWDMWPVYIIALGGFLLWRALRPPDPQKARLELVDSTISEYAIFGGGDLRVTTPTFTGGNLTAVFGGHEVDLTHSRIDNSPAVLYADAIFGGVSLRVPATWRVTTHGPAIFGGVDCKVLPPPDSTAPEQHLVVKCMAIFGGVEIKN